MLFRTIRYISLAAFCLCAICFADLRVIAADTWVKVETENFEVIGNASETEIMAAATRLERFRSAIEKVLSVRRNTSKTRVIVFKDAAAFRPFKPKRDNGTPDDLVSGLFQPGEDVNYIAIDARGSEFGTIYHEYTHDVLNSNFGTAEIPAWLNEGLAEYFEGFRMIDEQTCSVGGPLASHLNLLRQSSLMPWDEFLALDNFTLQQISDEARKRFYAQAWLLMQYLIRMAAVLTPSHFTDPPRNFRNFEPWMFQKVLTEIDRPSLESGIKALLADYAIAARTIQFTDTPPLYRVTASTVSEAQSNAYLGDLLYHLKDYQSAEVYLNRALASEPKLGAANASLGLVRLRQRKFTDAKRLLGIAIASDANNHLAHFYYAYLLTRENMDEAGMVSLFSPETAAKIRESLRRAIALNPQFPESYRLFAFTALITGEGLDEAVKGLEKAISLRPGDKEYALMEARIYLRQERIDDAHRTADRLVRSTPNPSTKREAESILRSANEIRAARSRTIDLGVNGNEAGFRKPVILQRRDLTDEQVAKIEEERVINNVNVLIERSKPGEFQAVGYLGKITCEDGEIFYRIKTESGELQLTSKRFDDLRLKVLIEGTRSFAFRCDSQVTDELAAIVYRPLSKSVRSLDGELLAISFVPKFFKLKSLEELAKIQPIIIEGRPTTGIEGNEKLAAIERAAMEREMRETQIRNIEEHLRKPENGEERVIATPERLECTNGKMRLTAQTVAGPVDFEAMIATKFEARSFNSDTGVLEVGCRSALPSVPGVITFRRNPQNVRELVAIEFVPKFFKLN